MATPKNDETTATSTEAPKPKIVRNNYRSPIQIGDGTVIPVGGSIPIDDMEALTKNRTVAAWLKAGVLEVI